MTKPKRPPAKSGKATKSAKATKGTTGAKPGAAKSRAAKPTATRAARLEEARRQRRRRSMGAWAALAAMGAVVVGAFVYSGSTSSEDRQDVVDRLEASPGNCVHDTEFDGTARNQGDHVQSPTYEVDPPAGGPHHPTPAEPGFFEGDDVPDDGRLVHAMEHGFVVLWYRPDADRQALEALSDRFGRELIVVPRASLDGEVAVTSWHRRLKCETLDPDAVALFTESFLDRGPEKGFL